MKKLTQYDERSYYNSIEKYENYIQGARKVLNFPSLFSRTVALILRHLKRRIMQF